MSIQTRTTATGIKKLMVTGGEDGVVGVYDVSSPANIKPACINCVFSLPTATGFTGIEDIEIRSVAARFDATGNLWIYAVSSGGDGATMTTAFRTKLPKFFVLEFVK
jgi:hypothetical protein